MISQNIAGGNVLDIIMFSQPFGLGTLACAGYAQQYDFHFYASQILAGACLNNNYREAIKVNI
jgi:hypothetical protein